MKDSPPTFSPARRQENCSELRAPVPHHDLLSLPAGVAGNQDHNAAALTADLSGVILGETVVARRRRRSQSAGSHAASGAWTRIETDRFRACRAPSHPAPSTVTSSDRSERQHRPPAPSRTTAGQPCSSCCPPVDLYRSPSRRRLQPLGSLTATDWFSRALSRRSPQVRQ